MTSTRWLLAVAILGIFSGGVPAAQGVQTKNPLEGNPDAIRGGMGLFRGRCADCHGMDARGVRGPDITQVWASGRTDDGLFKTIKSGIPGTEMPANPRINDRKPGRSSPTFARWPLRPRPIRRAATRRTAQAVFRAMCASCHRVERRRRPPGAGPVTHRRLQVARDDGAADSRQRRGIPPGIRTGDADAAQRSADLTA